MSQYVDELTTLMSEKKNKKSPSGSEKKQFSEAWECLVKESGYSSDAERFLYDGFWFCGSEPFLRYIQQSDDQIKTLRQFFNGKLYGNDSTKTFRVLANLFALLINENAPSEILALIIKHFPSACVNKDGKKLKTAAKSMELYFFDVLAPSADLIPLSDINLTPAIRDAFTSEMSSLIDEIKMNSLLKNSTISSITRVSAWIEMPRIDSVSEQNYEVIIPENTDPPQPPVAESKVESLQPDKTVIESDSIPSSESLSEVLKRAQRLSETIEREYNNQTYRIHELERLLSDTKQKLLKADERNRSCEATIQDMIDKNQELERQNKLLVQSVAEKEEMIANKSREMQEQAVMFEALNRDRSRQAEEGIQRIASKIKVEYRDFMDAQGVDMTVDLGENLRLQLSNVFDILEKGGMNIR